MRISREKLTILAAAGAVALSAAVLLAPDAFAHSVSADDIKATVDAGKTALDSTKAAYDAWQNFFTKAAWIGAGLQFLLVQGSAWSKTIRDVPGVKIVAGNYGEAENKH
jgi:hypothetical protein